MRTKFMNDHKNGKKHCAADFIEIHRYRHAVNQNVLKAITCNTFNQAKDLDQIGNLMEYEDKHIFMIHPSLFPKEANNKAKRKSKLVHIPLSPAEIKNKVINIFNYSELTEEQLRQKQLLQLRELKRENKERIARLHQKELETCQNEKLEEMEKIQKV